MTIDEMRKAMQEFCLESRCPSCPVMVVHGLCDECDWANASEDLWANALEDFWANAPEDLIEKAYLLAFGKIKEDEQMNNVEDAIDKTLEMVRGIVKAGNEVFVVGYIIGVWELTKKLTENKKEATR